MAGSKKTKRKNPTNPAIRRNGALNGKVESNGNFQKPNTPDERTTNKQSGETTVARLSTLILGTVLLAKLISLRYGIVSRIRQLISSAVGTKGQFSPDHGNNEADRTLEAEVPGNISLDLISGRTPAVRRVHGGVSFQYVSLVRSAGDSDKPELIRVLIVHPASKIDEPLECSIEVALLPHTQGKQQEEHAAAAKSSNFGARSYPYTALSYSWENQRPSQPIYIRVKGSKDTLTLLITQNLESALRQLRGMRDDKIFWVDAVCMNQDDKAEKNQQLPLMPRIYSEAKDVFVWLGVEDPKINIADAFGLIEKIRKWEDYDKVVEHETTCEEWYSFIRLMQRNWFKRRWIVQEIVLAGAENATIHWGNRHVSWIEFAQAVALFEGGLQDRVKKKFHNNPEFDNHPDMFGEVGEYNATRLVKVTAEIVSRRDDGGVVRKRETLESLISTLTPFDTGMLHDTVYAVLSLAKDVSAGPPTVDLKAELRISDLSPEMRKGCKDHAPKKIESGNRWSTLAIVFVPMSVAFTYGVRRYYQLSLMSIFGKLVISLVHRGVFYWVLIVALVVTIVKLAEAMVMKFDAWFCGILFKRHFTSRTATTKDLDTARPITVCQCERTVRVLNSVMRRLKLEKFPVDYDKPFHKVCDDLYTFTTSESASLDLTSRPWCPKAPNGESASSKWLPTWVRSLDDRPFRPDRKGHFQRVNADTLVGTPGTSPYQASGRYRSGWSFGGDNETQLLSARGFQLDTINSIEGPADLGALPKKWLRYRKPSGNEYDHSNPIGPSLTSKNSVTSQFWRTMIAGKGPNGQNPPLSYSLVCEVVCEELFNSDDGINLDKARNLSSNKVMKEFIDRILSVIWNRRLGKTTKLRRLVLLPYDAEKGDIICILYGCSVPAVLRKVGQKSSKGDDMWELIGECYVYEMMAGEALGERRLRIDDDKEFYKDRDFKIR